MVDRAGASLILLSVGKVVEAGTGWGAMGRPRGHHHRHLLETRLENFSLICPPARKGRQFDRQFKKRTFQGDLRCNEEEGDRIFRARPVSLVVEGDYCGWLRTSFMDINITLWFLVSKFLLSIILICYRRIFFTWILFSNF